MYSTLYTAHLERHGTDIDVGDRMSGENVRLFILSSDYSQENKTMQQNSLHSYTSYHSYMIERLPVLFCHYL